MDVLLAKVRLEEERASLLIEHRSLIDEDASSTLSESIGESSHYTDHPADTGTATFERERDIALLRSVNRRLHRVERALSKIDSGTYGVCDRCESEIPEARLQATPSASLCIACQNVEDAL